MCFVWIWEQTAIISLYSINWLVFITEKECVYCAVRSAHTVYLCVLCGSENKQRLLHCTALTDWFYNRDRVCLLRGTFCPHSVFTCFVWIWEQTAIISLYSIKWLVFVTETESVYCAVRSAHTVYSCVLCGSENKQRLFHCTALTDWFL
jgi:DNA-directed RNA polymerase subunit RPC12/RpoP